MRQAGVKAGGTAKAAQVAVALEALAKGVESSAEVAMVLALMAGMAKAKASMAAAVAMVVRVTVAVTGLVAKGMAPKAGLPEEVQLVAVVGEEVGCLGMVTEMAAQTVAV